MRAGRRPDHSVAASRNDTKILDTAEASAAHVGWSGLKLATVARAAKLSTRPLLDRFSGRSDLAAELWRQRLVDAFVEAAAEALASAGVMGDRPDREAFTEAMTCFVAPDDRLAAFTELLAVGPFDESLQTQVDRLAVHLAGWIRPQSGSVTQAQSTRRAYVIFLALGFLAASFRDGSFDVTAHLGRLFEALQAKVRPGKLPAIPAWYLRTGTSVVTADDELDDMVNAILELVGAKGYDATRTIDIARAAGVSEGRMFRRFPTKLDLLVEASRLQQAKGYDSNFRFQSEVMDKHGPAVAEAVIMRNAMRPSVVGERAITRELIRLGWHDQRLARTQEELLAPYVAQVLADSPALGRSGAEAEVHYQHAAGLGLLFLPLLDESPWRRPWDVVTVPLLTP